MGSVGHTVESKYGDGVFTQFSAPGGQLYQVRPLGYTVVQYHVQVVMGTCPALPIADSSIAED